MRAQPSASSAAASSAWSPSSRQRSIASPSCAAPPIHLSMPGDQRPRGRERTGAGRTAGLRAARGRRPAVLSLRRAGRARARTSRARPRARVLGPGRLRRGSRGRPAGRPGRPRAVPTTRPRLRTAPRTPARPDRRRSRRAAHGARRSRRMPSSRSSAYSRIVSSIRKRSSPTGFSRLESTSVARVSRSAAQTSSAAVNGKLPAKTDSEAKSSRPASSRSS